MPREPLRPAKSGAENIKLVAPQPVSFSERERFVMESALLYLPNDGTEWGPQIENTAIFSKNDRNKHQILEYPALMALWTIELRGFDYCLGIKNWYFRLINVAYDPFIVDQFSFRLGEHSRLCDQWTKYNSLAGELIYENHFGSPRPGLPSLTERHANNGGLPHGENNEH